MLKSLDNGGVYYEDKKLTTFVEYITDFCSIILSQELNHGGNIRQGEVSSSVLPPDQKRGYVQQQAAGV